jgi:hypothetical protein
VRVSGEVRRGYRIFIGFFLNFFRGEVGLQQFWVEKKGVLGVQARGWMCQGVACQISKILVKK